MGIYIKNMDLPKIGSTFRIVEDMEGNKFLTSADCMNGLYYPLVELPPHGDLIDRDALIEGRVSNDNVRICAENAPTVLEAEG